MRGRSGAPSRSRKPRNPTHGLSSIAVCLFVIALCWPFAARGEEPASRLPIPSEEAQAKSAAQIRDLFKSELANRSPEVRRSLAERLKTQADQTTDDPAGKFALLRESRDLFARSGAVRQALTVAREMENQFQVHGAVAETDALVSARGTPKSPEAAADLANASLGVAVAALHGNDIDNAAKAIKEAEVAVTHSISPLGVRVQAAAKRIRAAQQSAEAFAAAISKLNTDPADRKANLVAGRSLCFDYARWTEGAPLLARTGDEKLAAIAKAEIANPTEAPAVFALADAWWDLPETIGIPHAQSRNRARYWYERALEGSAGITRLKAQKRIDEADSAPDLPVLDLLALADPEFGKVNGVWKLIDDGLLSDPARCARLQLPYRSPDEYDFRIVFSRVSGNAAIDQICRSGENPLIWELGWGHERAAFGTLAGPEVLPGGTLRSSPIKLINGRRYTSVVSVRKNRIAAYLDGKLLREFDPRQYQFDLVADWRLRDSSLLGVGSWENPVLFYAVECVEISGRGEIVR